MKRVQEKNKLTQKQFQEKSKHGLLNFLFGRSTIILVLLILQITFFISLFTSWQYSAFAYSGSFALSVIMGLYLINRPMNSAFRQTWLILVLLVPVVGTALFFYVETDIGHRLVRRRLEQIQKDTVGLTRRPDDLMYKIHGEDDELYSLTRYMCDTCRFPIYTHTDVEYFPLGEDKFAALLRELEKAEKFIFMEYFIIAEGEMWDAILEILQRKVQQGVEVRVMYDGTCSIFKLPYRYPEKLRAMGIQCKMFAPIHPIFSTYYNNRDHRKILVIDGHTAFTGGVNLADEYINRRTLYGHWKDTAIMLKGPAVQSFTLMFLQMWGTSERSMVYRKYLDVPVPEYPESKGYVLPYGDNPFDDEHVGEWVYLDIISRSKRYVHIMTPYLIIDGEMTTALCFAAKRGVEVQLILPHIPDKKTAFSLAYTHYAQLIRAGVEIYEYTPGFLHAKVFVSDDIKAVVGTINLDYRSLYLHFECASYLYGLPVIADIERDFRVTQKKSQRVTLETMKDEKTYRKILGVLLKLLAPLM